MTRGAQRDVARQHLRHPALIGQRHLHRRRHDRAHRPLTGCAILRHHQPDQRAHRGVGRRQPGPAQRRDRPRGRDRGQPQMRRRDDRPGLGFAQGDPAVLAAADPDHLLAGLEIAPARIAKITVRGAGLHLLHHQVLVVHPGRRQPPGEPRIAARQDRGNARDRAAAHAARSQVHPGQIPQRRRGQRHMRVIGQQRRARGRPLARRGKGVGRGAAADLDIAQQRRRRVLRDHLGPRIEPRRLAEQRRIARQRRLARFADQVAGPLGRGQRDPGALHLGTGLVAGPGGDQLQDRERIRRLPEGDVAGQQEEFGRPAAARAGIDLLDPGVHPVGIGAQRRPRRLVLRGQRQLGVLPEPHAPGQIVTGKGAGAEHLGQPALGGAAQHHHLEQPVLGMGEAQREERVVVGPGEDMGHALGRAHDLDRLGDAGQIDGGVIIGQRADGEIPDQRDGGDQPEDQPDGQPDQPAKQRQHRQRKSSARTGAPG